MVEVCIGENSSPKKYFCFLYCFLHQNGLFQKKSRQYNFFVSRKQRIKLSGISFKKSGIISVAYFVLLSQIKVKKWYFSIGSYGCENHQKGEN